MEPGRVVSRFDEFIVWFNTVYAPRMNDRRFTNCACVGSWRDKLSGWRVLEPGSPSSLLYCVRCRFEWRSKAKYRHSLPTHTKRVRGTVTDAEILARLFDRLDLRIDPRTAIVESRAHHGGSGGGFLLGDWRALQQVADSHDSGYRFVNVSFEGRKRKIGVHVLQMMAHTREPIPEGFDVDHITSPPRPEMKSNALDNLRIVKSRLNQARSSDQAELAFMNGEDW